MSAVTTNYAPFDGDGRDRVDPIDAPDWSRPTFVTRASARKVVDLLVSRGYTVHSEHGSTIWVPLAWARANGREVRVEPGAGGYTVFLKEEPDGG